MKKNIMMRMAAVLLVGVLLTTSVIGGTFAKYVTSDYAEDTARVAKWGVTIEGLKSAENSMFADAYKDEFAVYTANEELSNITVQADTKGVDIVAPGTEGTLVAFDVSGKPEVDVAVTYVAELTLTNWVVDGAEYCPIVFTVNDVEIKMDSAITTVAALEKAVEDAIVAAKATYHTNTDLVTVEDDLKVTWAWAFDGDDAKDTALGDQAAKGTAANIALKVVATITQID